MGSVLGELDGLYQAMWTRENIDDSVNGVSYLLGNSGGVVEPDDPPRALECGAGPGSDQAFAAKAKAESQAGEVDEEKKLAAELTGLREKVKAVGEALEAKKKTLAPRVREAQNHVQQVSAALQKAVGPDASTDPGGRAAPRSGIVVTVGA